MTQEIFKRYEKKYMLTGVQKDILLFRLAGRMSVDAYGQHTISNLYYDTGDYELVRQSIEKPEYKEKLRLRAYGRAGEDSTVFLELKKKYDGVVYKRRIPIKLEEAEDYLCHGRYPERDSQILREIDYVLRRYDLEPAAYVAYDRVAMFGNDEEELRVTFDENIRCRSHGLDLKLGSHGTPILGKDKVLMEVKIPGAMPLWMCSLFSELAVYPVNFSKYGTFYKDYLLKQSLAEGGLYCA